MVGIKDLCMIEGAVEAEEGLALEADGLYFAFAVAGFAGVNLGGIHAESE